MIVCADSRSWIMLSYMGRRPIYLFGIITEAFCLLPIGIIGCLNANAAMLNALGALLTLINFIFHFSLGPVCE
jgi:SP family general alpha glucoside:H+ symporter-like MFS transporter